MKSNLLTNTAIISTTLALAGITIIDSTNVKASNNSKRYIEVIYNNDKKLLKDYQDTALEASDYQFYIKSSRVLFRVTRSYKLNPTSLKFDKIAQKFLVTNRFNFQKDTNKVGDN